MGCCCAQPGSMVVMTTGHGESVVVVVVAVAAAAGASGGGGGRPQEEEEAVEGAQRGAVAHGDEGDALLLALPAPGQNFHYKSSSGWMATPYGTMHGSYQFVDEDTGDLVEATIAPFGLNAGAESQTTSANMAVGRHHA
ncbi:uncharacterized protein ACA1_158210 [Acanthamoeba castellanii str. Neff]|uniref:Uncharacterized protein n=1 Tax=Acanthamoeba castellanii (strain ATCC 30010 / Neff) TaxID=1257118 RepID=L8HA13_ACACF|nr:uncharacterized protein ACA1_158210 [Acanthamoeba castellanii str. Neff]ELR22067.1 hypothetical protein ACA1_158210 [Acanthamoeba castellanii str. Neff]